MKKSVIIIGAGVGGLATAIRLLSRGYNVKIYEKQKTIGGRTNQLIHDPFTFDLTASILLNREILEEVFSYAHLDFNDYIEFVKIDPTYRCFYPDGTQYDFSRDLVSLIKTLESFSIEDSIGYIKLFGEVYERYNIANRDFLQRSFENPVDFFNPSSLISALKTKAFSTSYQLISEYIKDEKLINFLCYQSLYVGVSPYEGPSIYALVPVISQLYGLWHLRGGVYSYIKALEKVIYQLGGEIITNYSVDEIIISDDKAIGVKSKELDEVYGDIIVSNADFPYTMAHLIKSGHHKGEYTKEKLKEMKYSCSSFILYLGLKTKYPQLSVHNLYLNTNFKENVEFAFTGKLPPDASMYIYCPTGIDDSMIKNEGESLSVVVRVPNLLFDSISWDKATVMDMRNRIVDTLKTIKGLEDLEENIEYEGYFTPKDLKNDFNSYGGTAYGLSPTLTQTNYFRPHFKSTQVKNLYFVGSSVHPGPGVSIVLLSSKLVTEEILKDTSSRFY
ncbi:phytoene desaturase family protein [Alkaliphilus hydrothermalis]|uniref:Phytoene desaturase n=1 Tax=Alkaliphilus hydrothermalis TaxID=1482730 RepID=A0ABS2NT50_9FIRM|nr:phytoene desaturase family protein [Alkaliphilus hydrothermalis]MBM7616133.1 phytoene desaturase [Alkaliphilus hydrothermalis]